MPNRIGRRRFLAISAAAAGLGLVPVGAPRESASADLIEWHGTSLGAIATIRVHHTDRIAAQRLLRQVVGEALRLETVFSLYRPDSSLCELNRRGVLIAPPAELSDLLTLCERFWRLTDGMFDPTVQALWRCYADHFALAPKITEAPSKSERKEALKLVGWEKVRFDRDRVAFDRRGMGLTLNGIAQGYITDHVVELLRAAGIESCLVDMGEIRALGQSGEPWRVALENPSGEVEEDRSISIVNKAVASSCAAGFRFDDLGRSNHLFDPSTGTCASPTRTLTVVTPAAVTADALSTAFALMDEERIKSVLSRSEGTEAYITTESGTRVIAAASR
jgi:thiamine biosynthesis lipoprotein